MATKSWANILNEENASKPAVATTTVQPVIPADVKRENEGMLHGFKVPDLAKRSDIVGHFPVMLFKHDDAADGTKRFAVTLDGRRFKDMKEDEENEEAREDFEYYTLWRLVYALRLRSDLYTIERPPAMAFAFVLAMKPAPPSDAMPLSTHDFMEKKGLEEPRAALPSEYNEVLNNASVNVKYTRKNRGHHRNHTRSHAPSKLTGRAAVEMEIRNINKIVPIVWADDQSRGIFLLDIKRMKLDRSKYPTDDLARRKLKELLTERTAAGKLIAYEPKGSDSRRDGIVKMTM